MEPARVRADDFGHRGGEGDDVVRTSASISWMRSTRKSARSLDGLGGVLRDDSGFSQRFGGGDFDGQPGAKAVFSLQMRAISGRV